MRGSRTAAGALVLALGLATVSPALAGPAPHSDTVAQKLRAAAAALEGSSAAVQAAGLALARSAAELPGARAEVARSSGELAGAQALADEAARRVHTGEVLLTAAVARVDRASAALDDSRLRLGRLARRSYQLGPLDGVRVLTESGPAEVLDRATMLQEVFQSGEDTLHALAVQRLALARERARVDDAQRELDAERATADSRRQAAADAVARARAAADRVAQLVADRAAALRTAQAQRQQDERDYRAAQAASAALAARIRALAAARRRAGIHPIQHIGRLLWPADGPLTSRYGWRMHPIFHEMRFHAGIDIGASYGAPAWAADAGTVTYAGPASGYGTLVVISHGNNGGKDLSTAYAHLSRLDVSVGQEVGRGQQIGAVGNEGNSTGPHLHFEVRLDGSTTDPLDWVSPP